MAEDNQKINLTKMMTLAASGPCADECRKPCRPTPNFKPGQLAAIEDLMMKLKTIL